MLELIAFISVCAVMSAFIELVDRFGGDQDYSR